MPEYVMGEDEDRGAVARRLIEQVGPERADQVIWQPRADVPGGGVFLVPDDVADTIGQAATTEHGTPKAGGEYPYDGDEEGDPERRETDASGQDAEADDDADGPATAEDTTTGDKPLPTTRRRRAAANTTEQ